MNWKELKDFANSLPESELEKIVILWREDESISDISAEQLDEDMYVDKEEPENGCFSLSEAQSFIKITPEDYADGMNHFRKVYDKGTPILQENF